MKIHHEGTAFLVAAGLFLSFLCLYVYLVVEQRWPFWLAVVVSVVLLGIAFNFYRSPHRIYGKPTDGLVLASADGHIVAIEEVDEPEVLGGKCLMISTFMSLFNVHAQWVPVAGEVTYVRHHRAMSMLPMSPRVVRRMSAPPSRSSLPRGTTSWFARSPERWLAA